MRIDHLREFVELTYCCNFSKAAKNLHITQSSLSKHVLALESDLGVQLLEREQAQVFPTKAGRIFFEEAITIIEAFDRMHKRIAELKETPAIILGGLYGNPLISKLTRNTVAKINLQGKTPIISHCSKQNESFCDLALNGAADVVFTMMRDEVEVDEPLESMLLFKDPLVAVVDKKHPLAEKASLDIHDLEDMSLLRPEGSHSITGSKIAAALLADRGVNVNPIPVLLPNISDLALVDVETHVLLIEQSFAALPTAFEGRRIIPFEDPEICFPFCAVFRKDSANPVLPLFTETLAQAVSEMQQLS